MDKNFKKHLKNGKKIACKFSDTVSDFASKRINIINKIKHRNRNTIAIKFSLLLIIITALFFMVMILKHKISEDL